MIIVQSYVETCGLLRMHIQSSFPCVGVQILMLENCIVGRREGGEEGRREGGREGGEEGGKEGGRGRGREGRREGGGGGRDGWREGDNHPRISLP